MFHLSQALSGPFFIHDITRFVTRLTRRVPLVEQELLHLPEHLSSPRVLVGFVLLDHKFYVYVFFLDRCLSFCTFTFGIVLSVLQFTDPDYPFGIFKLFLCILYLDVCA
jgi:hypothetical protein